jgi:hypothetical protein
LTVPPPRRSLRWNGLGFPMGFYFFKVIVSALVVVAITPFYRRAGAFWRRARSSLAKVTRH